MICNVYLCGENIIRDNGNYNSNLVKLFLADKLIIESLGIQYNKYLMNLAVPVQFDVDPDGDYPVFDPSDFSVQYGVFI